MLGHEAGFERQRPQVFRKERLFEHASKLLIGLSLLNTASLIKNAVEYRVASDKADSLLDKSYEDYSKQYDKMNTEYEQVERDAKNFFFLTLGTVAAVSSRLVKGQNKMSNWSSSNLAKPGALAPREGHNYSINTVNWDSTLVDSDISLISYVGAYTTKEPTVSKAVNQPWNVSSTSEIEQSNLIIDIPERS